MKLMALIQDSQAYDTGQSIGYVIGRILPFLIILVLIFFIVKYFRNKSKK